jgi:DNA-binding NtrC family response regulator
VRDFCDYDSGGPKVLRAAQGEGGSKMKGLALREHSDIHLVNGAGENNAEEKATPSSKTKTLKQLALQLLLEAQSLTEVTTLDVRGGIDFYEEVKRFEVDLIQRALSFTGGNQVRAAGLLKMKVTTLNSKIKHYNINTDVIVGCYVPLEVAEAVHNQA